MNNSILLFTVMLSMMIFSSCDPAQRLKIVNLSDTTIEINRESLYPNFINHSTQDLLDEIVIIENGDNNSIVEFYGIGGWWDGSEMAMKNHLDSVLSISFETVYRTNSSLSEFGSSLMTYTIEN